MSRLDPLGDHSELCGVLALHVSTAAGLEALRGERATIGSER
jgi:hypothetical protein